MRLSNDFGSSKTQRLAGRREPLKTVSELAEEFGITKQLLGHALAEPGAPLPVVDGKAARHALRAKWFKPSEVRAWWKGRTC